jgi:1-acyl-sn-glycerol-3-phosphate acyltransferase
VFVQGLESARQLAERGPIIVAANHVSWWDVFVALVVDEALGTESHCLMDADNLACLPFFAAVGAVPLRRSRPRDALEDLEAAASLLDRPGQAVWIFPQGRHRPPHRRPLGLGRGVRTLVQKSGAPVVPLSITYAFRESPSPALALWLGPARAGSPRGLLTDLESLLCEGLDRGDDFLADGRGAFDVLVPPPKRPGVPAAGRLLARLGGGGSRA